MKVCPGCKANNADDAGYCENCGVDLSSPRTVTSGTASATYPPEDYSPTPLENIPPHPPALMKAGSLLLVVGVIGALISPGVIPQLAAYESNSGTRLLALLSDPYYEVIRTSLALAGLVGGVLTLLRRGFYAALALGVLACFAIGPIFITTAGAIIGTITVALNRRDFIPLFHGPPDNDRPCPVCRHPLHWVNGYREWYCFNCKNYRKLPVNQLKRPAPRPKASVDDDPEDEDDST